MRLATVMRSLPGNRGAMLMLFLVWAVWLSSPYFGLGGNSYVRIHDNADGALPAKVAQGTAIPSHLSSAWDPQPVSGFDQVPWSSSADLDSWLFAVLPGWAAYGLIMFAQRFIAGYFTYRLLKDRLRAGALASLCGGLVYACFAQPAINASWAGFTLYDGLALAGLPLVLWSLDPEAGHSLKKRLVIAATLGFLLGITSPFFLAVFVVLAVVVWLLARRGSSTRRTLLVVALFVSAWLVAEIPAIWASLLNSPLSHRSEWVLQSQSLGDALARQYSYVRDIVRDNQVMAAAALVGLVVSRLRDRTLVVALGAAGAILLVVMVSAVWLAGVRGYAGPLGGFQVDRIYLLAPFALIVAGSLGLDTLAKRLRARSPSDVSRSGRVWAAGVTLVAILALGLLTSARVQLRIVREMQAGSSYAALLERPELERLAAVGRDEPPYRVATVYVPQAFAPVPDSIWPWLIGQLPAYAWAYGFETVDGYVNLYSKRYHDYWGLVTEPALAQDQALRESFEAWGNRLYLFIPDAGAPPAGDTKLTSICDTDLLSLSNVRYVLSPVRLTGSGLTLVSGNVLGEPWPLYVYENTQALPRYFVVGSARDFADRPSLLRALSDAPLAELKAVAFVEAGNAVGLQPASPGMSQGQVRLDSYAADSTTLSLVTDGRSLLVCTMNYSPYWRAYVDGHEAKVIPVNHTFVGVVVPGGAHQVELRYQPPYAWLLPG